VGDDDRLGGEVVVDFRIVTGIFGVFTLALLLVRELYPRPMQLKHQNTLDVAVILAFAILAILVLDGIYHF